MKRLATVATVMVLVTAGTTVVMTDGFKRIRERLSGFEEVPVVSTTGRGSFVAKVDEKAQEIAYELSWAGLEGSVLQAHIHLGDSDTNGGIAVWLCGNVANTPAGVQPCPASDGMVSGVITPANVVGPAGQGIAAGEFDELVRAIRAGLTYVNVHSSLFPGGEIRSQISHDRHHDRD